MTRGHLPANAFVHPDGKNAHDVKQLICEITNLVVMFASFAGKRPPFSPVSSQHFGDIPERGVAIPDIVQQLQRIMEAAMNPYNPFNIGHMDSIPTLISTLGDFISSSLNNNMLSLEMSPIFSKMEVEVLQAFSKLFGYSSQSGGVMLRGGSLANLQALTVARNRTFSVLQDGLTGLEAQPVVFASESAHTSLQKAAMILGLGTSSIIAVKTNNNSQMDVNDLETKIELAFENRKKPFAIVATAGTTVTGNIDPLHSISAIARRFGLWFHVDAAYGGALVFSPNHIHRLTGIESADSITFNPQKWMYVAKTCVMVLFKEKEVLHNHFRIPAPYMNDTEFTNFGEISVQGTRHTDILKLWLSLQHLGLKGYEQLLEQSYVITDTFVKHVKQRPYLELASEPETNLCCFRGRPEYLSREQWDKWNFELQQTLLREEQVFFSLPSYRGSRWLRCALLNPLLSEEMITEIFKKIDKFYSVNRPS